MKLQTQDDDENLWDDPLVKTTDEHFDFPEASRRFIGFFADVLATAIAYYMLVFALLYLFKQTGSAPTGLFDGLFSWLFPILVYLLFVGSMELLTGGQSIGKLVTGTTVIGDGGSPPSLGQIALRSCARLIPGEALMVLFDRQKRAGHDMLSRTRVIRKNPFNG